ncbi:hypothetical protein Tco_0513563 [Tanacetum coccineum]
MPLDIQYSAATQIWGCYRLVSEPSSHVFCIICGYLHFPLHRFRARQSLLGADEEISNGDIPRVIVYGYDGLPMQSVAPPSPDYIPAYDPDYVPEPIYPEYIPLEDEHVFLAEEQPLPSVDSPTAESPGYVAE